MDHEILVSIMKRLGLNMLLLSTCLVSKSWLNATLDALFPPCHAFDLRDCSVFSTTSHCQYRKRNRLWKMIELHLNRNLPTQHYYTSLVLRHRNLTIYAYRFIAQRLPSITSLTICNIGLPKLLKFRDFASCWKGLVEVDCDASCVRGIGLLWNQIHKLKLYGDIKVHEAISIANDFPCLTHLSLKYCKLSDDGLSLILEGQKNLTYLNMTHARVGGKRNAKDWDKDLLLLASKIPQFLRCEMGNCCSCFPCYRPS
ncbi:uncharacterized protein LOC110703642 [Chenopodium quinoa]|uniref:uncharacterized protein LOC110703642 n=1 Tax=Chenopodium quinoa TaxID=63459 RepID=UPI000B76CA8F|nr:uncharacterized protein LOC110703642 [Chenopodium quinoa]XP_021737125.1 uncharacterized protein LOC110703642 [Chenopodium quinoa]